MVKSPIPSLQDAYISPELQPTFNDRVESLSDQLMEMSDTVPLAELAAEILPLWAQVYLPATYALRQMSSVNSINHTQLYICERENGFNSESNYLKDLLDEFVTVSESLVRIFNQLGSDARFLVLATEKLFRFISEGGLLRTLFVESRAMDVSISTIMQAEAVLRELLLATGIPQEALELISESIIDSEISGFEVYELNSELMTSPFGVN